MLVQNTSEGHTWVEFDPRRRQHEVDVTLELVAPELDDAAQVELADHFVALDQCVHVRFEAMLGVHALLVELNLDEAIRVGTDDEVDLRPIDHDYFLDIVDDVRQLLRRESL